MKRAGLSAVVLLCVLLFLGGCIQVIINPPGTPGVVAPVVTTTTQLPVADDTPLPVATTNQKDASVATSTHDPRFIVPVGDTSRVGHRIFTFNYASEYGGSHEYNLKVPINMSVYYGAKQMKIGLPANSMNPEEIKAYINSFESDPAMNEVYDDVLKELRNARYRDGGYLSDDEYLELIVAFVQQIPLVENPSPYRKYPVEVIYDKSGDSDEKSLLLVNLLAREGYDVSLMVFEDEGYETTGIRVLEQVPDSSLKLFSNGKKDYIFIDASLPAFIGSVPRKPVDFENVDDPTIYPVGNGTKSYGPVNYVWKVVADLHRMAELGKIDKTTVINRWDRTGTCSWIKNSKLLKDTTCYCCDM
ncbi:MAG: hypothetical protein CVV30_10915 [Methanomicrobiales archaeon HGW-Methanomicrobiales-1]|nr:MAG: hypothetical protein CVV30_10915 [Methanomicrobiales archaeon HGW-Methanomicrobiales-1]